MSRAPIFREVPIEQRPSSAGTHLTRMGRLANIEYDVVDMSRRTGITDAAALADYVGRTSEACTRGVRMMIAAGILQGRTSAFSVTPEGMRAFIEADTLMLRPPKPRRSRIGVEEAIELVGCVA